VTIRFGSGGIGSILKGCSLLLESRHAQTEAVPLGADRETSCRDDSIAWLDAAEHGDVVS
jgi:hypothetical protein